MPSATFSLEAFHPQNWRQIAHAIENIHGDLTVKVEHTDNSLECPYCFDGRLVQSGDKFLCNNNQECDGKVEMEDIDELAQYLLDLNDPDKLEKSKDCFKCGYSNMPWESVCVECSTIIRDVDPARH